MSSSTFTPATFACAASIPSSAVDSLLSSLHPAYTSAGQMHVFAFVNELSDEQKKELYFDLQNIQVEKIEQDWAFIQSESSKLSSSASSSSPSSSITPFTRLSDLSLSSPSTRSDWRRLGLDAISRGEVAAVLMAGGQGTRLGSANPKGMYDIGLPSGKSLFQLQAERILRLRHIAADHAAMKFDDVHLRWYIMTSIVTHQSTIDYFALHSHFGLPASDIFFFQQSELPALDATNGKIVMDDKHRISLSPNGNGGVFEGLKRRGALEDMKTHGITSIHIYGVDNVLAKVGDPSFIGFSIAQQSDVSNKVVLKTNPHEKVGVMCMRDGRPSVVEYSELPRNMSEMTEVHDGGHKLVYSAGNIVQHYFTFAFLQSQADSPLLYHIAHKCIPHVSSNGSRIVPTKPNGVKLEYFVFDAFERSDNLHCLAVPRQGEFSPVKNAEAEGVSDTPATARRDVGLYHTQLLKDAGATIIEAEGEQNATCQCEISPLVSYSGEGLDSIVADRTISLPFLLSSADQLK